jgi:hypothetical protein
LRRHRDRPAPSSDQPREPEETHKYGVIQSCGFHVGYFDATLPDFDRTTAFVFADVDLRDSVDTCVSHLWPLLSDGGYFYTHEAAHMEIASLFFDREWWRATFNCEAPGPIGAGTGLGLIPAPGGFRSALGYSIKAPDAVQLEEVPQPGLSPG